MQRFVIVRIGNEYFGLSISSINSIEKMIEPTQIPTTHSWLTGVINLRDRVMPIIDSKQILFNKMSLKSDSTKLIITESDGKYAALMVDDAIDIYEFFENDIKEIDFENCELNFLEGVVKKEDQLISILNTKNLLEALNDNVIQDIHRQMLDDLRFQSVTLAN